MEKGQSVQGQCAYEPGRKPELVSAVSTVRVCRDQGVIQT